MANVGKRQVSHAGSSTIARRTGEGHAMRFGTRKWVIGVVTAVSTMLFMASPARAITYTVPDGGCTLVNTVYFCDADLAPVGTGNFQPFLRVNAGGSVSIDQGWNTQANIANTNTSPNGSGQNPLNYAD